MAPSPTQAAYWQHRGDHAFLICVLWLLVALLCWIWSRRLARRSRQPGRGSTVEGALPLRGRWLRYFLVAFVWVALLLATGRFAESAMYWREAARYVRH